MVPPPRDISCVSLGAAAVVEAGADFAESSWGKVPYVNLSIGDYLKERSWGHIKAENLQNQHFQEGKLNRKNPNRFSDFDVAIRLVEILWACSC